MVTKLYGKKPKDENTYLKICEDDQGRVKIISVNSDGSWRKDICVISEKGIGLYSCAYCAGIETNTDGTAVVYRL